MCMAQACWAQQRWHAAVRVSLVLLLPHSKTDTHRQAGRWMLEPSRQGARLDVPSSAVKLADKNRGCHCVLWRGDAHSVQCCVVTLQVYGRRLQDGLVGCKEGDPSRGLARAHSCTNAQGVQCMRCLRACTAKCKIRLHCSCLRAPLLQFVRGSARLMCNARIACKAFRVDTIQAQ